MANCDSRRCDSVISWFECCGYCTSALAVFESQSVICRRPDAVIIKLFSSSAQLSMKFQLLINAEMVKISGKFRFIPQELVIYPAHKC